MVWVEGRRETVEGMRNRGMTKWTKKMTMKNGGRQAETSNREGGSIRKMKGGLWRDKEEKYEVWKLNILK